MGFWPFCAAIETFILSFQYRFANFALTAGAQKIGAAKLSSVRRLASKGRGVSDGVRSHFRRSGMKTAFGMCIHIHTSKDPIFRLTNESKQPATFISAGQRRVSFFTTAASPDTYKQNAFLPHFHCMQKPPRDSYSFIRDAAGRRGVQYLGPNNAESHHYLPEAHYRFRRRQRWQWTQIELENILSAKDWRWKYAALGRNYYWLSCARRRTGM